jgi:hypothetical protein
MVLYEIKIRIDRRCDADATLVVNRNACPSTDVAQGRLKACIAKRLALNPSVAT